MSDPIRVEKRIKFDVEDNCNKFWTGELYQDKVITRWGRIGDSGQSKEFPGNDVSFLEKKLREKEKKGYHTLNVIETGNITTTNSTVTKIDNVASVAKKQIVTNNPIVTKLIEYFARVNAHQITQASGGKISYNDTTGLFSTPLGVITQSNIDEANTLLDNVADLVANKDYGNKLIEKTNLYMMLVPADTGHKRLDVRDFWGDLNKVQAQKQILDNLQASLTTASSRPISAKIDSPIEKEEKVFDCQLHLIEDGKIIDKIRKMYKSTHQSGHACQHLDVKTVYSVNINTVKTAFERDGAKLNNVWTLWHGTRSSNCLSILRGGLVIPPSSSPHVCGRMFGDGLYFSDQSTKSLNYAYGYWGSGNRDNNCFMFSCSVGMGNFYVPPGPFSAKKAPNGYESTFAKAQKSGVANNEMIVYRVSQANLDYLIEFSPAGK